MKLKRVNATYQVTHVVPNSSLYPPRLNAALTFKDFLPAILLTVSLGYFFIRLWFGI